MLRLRKARPLGLLPGVKTRPISECMSPNPHTVGQEQTLAVAAAEMRERGIRHLPVLHGGKLVGLLTLDELRVVEALPNVDDSVVKVEEALSGEPYAVAPEKPLSEVVKHMAAHKLTAAVVVSHDQVKGVFTTEDALRLLGDVLAG